MKKEFKLLAILTPSVILFSCVAPKQTISNQKLSQVNNVKDLLKNTKAEYFDLSPTETFVLMAFKSDQLNLNAWCLQKGGTPYYCYRDSFGDEVCQKLVNSKGEPKYASDLYENPKTDYVVCKLPNGEKLYEYRSYLVGSGYRYTADLLYPGFVIKHAPLPMDYRVRLIKVPNSLQEMDYTNCHGNYCRSSWFIHREVLGMDDFGNLVATYLYCKYKLNGKFYKGDTPFEKWFKEVFIKEGAAGRNYDEKIQKEISGFYYCYDGDKSFKVKVYFDHYFEGTAKFNAIYKLDPSLKNKKPKEVSSNINQPQTMEVQSAALTTPTAFSSFEEIALYVAKTKKPFNASAGGVLVMATPTEIEENCVQVLIRKFVNGPLTRQETLKVCNGKVVKAQDTHPASTPRPSISGFSLTTLIPNCQAYGSAVSNFAGYTIECKALDENRCHLQIITKAGETIIDTKTINVCNK